MKKRAFYVAPLLCVHAFLDNISLSIPPVTALGEKN